MPYSQSDTAVLQTQRIKLAGEYYDVLQEALRQASTQSNERVREFLTYGVGRRLNILELCTRKVFDLFPPDQEEVPPVDTTREVSILLQAFLMHVSGVFDNLAWAFILRHDLFEKIGAKQTSVGVFLPETSQCFPHVLRDYVVTKAIPWHRGYMKGFRDGMVHRVPLFVPPYTVNPEDHEAHRRLEEMKAELVIAGDWEGHERVNAAQDHIGKAFPVFLADFSRYIPFHPQLNADGALVLEFTRLFFKTWHEFIVPASRGRE
jgi:hypothetical protein